MSEAGERTDAWRRAKHKAGYVPLNIYMPAGAKAQLAMLAAQRGQSLAACLTQAIALLGQSTSAPKTFLVDERQLQRTVGRMVDDRLSERQSMAPQDGQAQGTTTDDPEPPPPGMKRCGQGHRYPVLNSKGNPHKGCPECDKAKHRRLRAKQR
jgi:hypothetical protein